MKFVKHEPSPSRDPDIAPNVPSAEPIRIIQNELSNLVRDLELLKSIGDLSGLRRQQWNFLDENVTVSVFCVPHKDFTPFFKMEGNLQTCNYVDGLIQPSILIITVRNGDCSETYQSLNLVCCIMAMC